MGQVAVVTGAGSGFGAAVARDLDPAGLALVVAGRTAAPVEKLPADLGRARVIVGDIAEPATPGRLIG